MHQPNGAMLDHRLSYAVAVARAGSFTAAAEAVGVTQSTVTKSVADLEQRLGYALFHRTARGALLTEAGRDFVERAGRLLNDTNELMRRPQVGGDPCAGPLRIGVCPASLEWRLVEPLALLLKRHPGVRFDLIGSAFERMVQLLRNGGVDVALGFDDAFSQWSDIHREPLPAVKSTLFVRRDHPILSRGAITPRDITDFVLVTPSDGRPNSAAIKTLFETEGVDWPSHVHVVDYFPIVRRLVASSDAIGVVTQAYSRSSSFLARFAALDRIDLLPPSPMCCAVRTQWDPKPAVRALTAAIRDVPV